MGGAMNLLGSALARFADLFEAHVREGRCPVHRGFAKRGAA